MTAYNDIRDTQRVTAHPGEILKEEFLAPHGTSATALAAALRVPANRISEIVAGRRAMTADTALRLAGHYGTSPEFWMNLQAMHDLSRIVVDGRRAGAVKRAVRKTRAA